MLGLWSMEDLKNKIKIKEEELAFVDEFDYEKRFYLVDEINTMQSVIIGMLEMKH